MFSNYRTKQLRYKGATPYRGFDPISEQMVQAKQDEVIEVSEDKAAQVLSDFPNDFEAVTKTVAPEEPAKEEKPKSKGKK